MPYGPPSPLQGFSVWAPDEIHGWLGASPDGLLTYHTTEEPHHHQQQEPAGGAAESKNAAAAAAAGPGTAAAATAAGAGTAADEVAAGFDGFAAEGSEPDDWVAAKGEGVLEIKCPFKASPEMGGVLTLNEYYMHQVGAGGVVDWGYDD